MVATFLAVGAVGFWILVAVVCILLFLEVEHEKTGWATITCILFFAALWLFGDFNVLTVITENPLLAVGCIVGYLLLGTGWSFGKWWFYVKRCRREYDKVRAAFMRQENIQGETIPADKKQLWRQYWAQQVSYDNRAQREQPIPRAGQHKGSIVMWMVYWPWSMVWTVINDPVKRAFKEIFYRLKVVYQAIANSVFRGVEEDFEVPPDDDGGEHLLSADQVREKVARNRAADDAGNEEFDVDVMPVPAGLVPESESSSSGGTPAK